MQVQPSIQLSPYIRHYLFIKQEKSRQSLLRLFSDGNTGLVFHNSPHLTLNEQRLPNAFFYGQITDYQDLFCQGPADIFVVVFHPDGLYRLLNIPPTGLTNTISPFPDSLDPLSVVDKKTLLDTFFEHRLTTHPPAITPIVTNAINFIQKQNGLLSIDQLEKHTGQHRRQLERQFASTIGLSPKKYCTITRVHSFLKHLQKNKQDNLTQCAYESGYYDQAHLIHDFRQLTGLTPSQYLKKTFPLAVNLVAFLQF